MGEPKFPTPGEDRRDQGGEKKFEARTKPELGEGYTENSQKTENDQPLKYEVFDEKGNVIYREVRWYRKSETPSQETMGGHRQHFFKYDDQNRVTEEVGQALSTKPGDPEHEKQWRNSIEYGEDDSCVKTGTIETGPDTGHKWQAMSETKRLEDYRRIVTEITKILEQGQNLEKPDPGLTSKAVRYFKGREWLGTKTTDLRTNQEYENLAQGTKKLPDWE